MTDIKFETSHPPSNTPSAAIILAHGAGQGMDSPFMTYFHNELGNRGFLSVKFNFDYMEAKRRFPDPQAKLQSRYQSVVEAVAAQYHPHNLFIGGKSMGGRVASYIAPAVSGLRGLIFLGYPLHPPGKPDQLRDQHLYALKIPMLFISGTKDTFAGQSLLEQVVGKIGNNARLVWIEGGDHSLKRKRGDVEGLALVADIMDQWIRGLS